MSKASLLVLNHQGRAYLEEFLPSVVRAARSGGHEVVVVDNASTDGSREAAWRLGADCVLAYPDNRYLMALNDAAREARHDLLVFLNNDLEVAAGFLPPLLRHFRDPQVFAVGCRILEPDGRTLQMGSTAGFFSNGLLHAVYHLQHLEPAPDHDGPRLTLYPPGGACMVRRDRFLDLGGFDPLFHPIYMEDVDLGYAAWRRGWKVVYEPASVVVHLHGATMRRAEVPERIRQIRLKNEFMLVWKNVSDRRILAQSFRTWARLVRESLAGQEKWRLPALAEAARLLPQVVRRRRELLPHVVLADREILPLHVQGIVRAGLGRAAAYPGDVWDSAALEPFPAAPVRMRPIRDPQVRAG